MTNLKYGKIECINSNFNLKFAPLLPEGSTDEDYLELGWKKIVLTNPPEYDLQTQYAFQNGYDETDTQLVSKWKIIDKPTPPMLISKYKLIKKLMENSLWAQCKQMIEESGLWDLFNAAQELNSNDQFFKQGVELAKDQFSMSDEQIKAFLQDCFVD